jgi:hypothetical protein
MGILAVGGIIIAKSSARGFLGHPRGVVITCAVRVILLIREGTL